MKRTGKLLGVFIAILMIFALIKLPLLQASTSTGDLQERLKDAVVLYVGSSGAIANNTDIQIDPSNLEVQPVIKESRTLVPIRFITESLGAEVEWDSNTSKATVTLRDKTVELAIGSQEMKVNGTAVNLEVPAEIINERTFIPLRQLTEALGKKVFYDRGLIVISDRDNIFDGEKEKLVIDEVIARVNVLPTLGSYDNLKALLDKIQTNSRLMYGRAGVVTMFTESTAAVMARDEAVSNSAQSAASGAPAPAAAKQMNAAEGAGSDYSATNVQVQGVDEADIVKTDGEYIYQVNNQRVIVCKAYPDDQLEVTSILDFANKSFTPQELYLDKDTLVVIGSSYDNNPVIYNTQDKKRAEILPERYYYRNTAKAVVFDITDRTKISKVREVEVEGGYVSSRKIGSTVYLIANKYMDLYTIQEQTGSITPQYRDTAVKDDFINVDYPEIRYFPGLVETNYMTVASFNVDKPDEKANVFTYLGAGQNIYASQENLYIAVTKYSPVTIMPAEPAAGISIMPRRGAVNSSNTLVYRFSLKDGQITYLNKGEVPGAILNQFSMDENGKYFRIATTVGEVWGTGESVSKNNVYILDETMNITGKIEDMAPGERIYSVRFMGDRGYVVTFKTVDPLFVIDLKDPGNPGILGALKIPGYSDYLHPYDENHIIGFGKDTIEVSQKDGAGKAVASTAFYQGMKIAIFDVSDVSNPKQKFSQMIGDRGTDSELLHNHKALLFSKEKNLLAFPVTLMEVKGSKTDEYGYPRYGEFTFQGAYVYDIDLEKGFTLKGRITHIPDEEYLKAGNSWYSSDRNVERILYINDTLYTLSKGMIKANNMGDLAERNSVVIP